MSKLKLLKLFSLCFALSISLTFCKSNSFSYENKSSWIAELSPELDRSYILHNYSNFRELRIEVGKNPVSRSKNEWMLTVYHTRKTDLEAWQNKLSQDPAILRFYPADHAPDPPAIDTLKGGKKISPKF